MTTIKRCGFCSLLGGMVRRALCIGSRRGSSESYYRELGDQDTLKADGSLASDDSIEIHIALPTNENNHDCDAHHIEDSADARSRASTSTACHQHAQASRAHAQGSAGRIQVPALEAELVAVPEAVETAVIVPEAGAAASYAYKARDMTRSRPMGRFLSMHKRRRRHLPTRSLVDEEALLDDLLIGQVQCILEQSAVWGFNAFTLDNVAAGRGLPVLCVHLFQVYGLISHFRLDAAKVWKLFSLFEENYHSSNPYHNSIHAADVTQAMHCFLQQGQILEHLQPIEVMASLLAAMAHDLDHPGVNQPFLVATSNHLVALYQSKSVLENHHWRSAVSCLIESQILDEMPQYQQQLEDKIRSLILATDITRQQDYLGQFKVYLDTNTLDLACADHRHLVLQIALKCADISNPCRPWEISRTWSLKVCEEFFRQGDVERRLNLPLSPLCDRNTTTVPKIQAGFYKYVVTPLITEWHRFLQSDLSEQMLNNLVTNHQRWEAYAKDLREAPVTPAAEVTETVDDEADSAAYSGSSEMLIPLPRRSSLNPATSRPAGFREQLRRFSVPLNVFQEPRVRGRELAQNEVLEPVVNLDGSPDRSLLDEQSELSEKLLPESSIASITTPQQAQRINNVFHERHWKLVRQPTFPPLEMISRTHSLIPRSSSHDDSIYPRAVKSDSGIRFDLHGADERHQKPGNRLRDNLTAWHFDLSRRRKSMPAEPLAETSARERRFRELREVLPQLIARTLVTGRRGSAPAPVSLGSAASRNASNGNRMPRTFQIATPPSSLLSRRSSLPVEAFHHAKLARSSE